MSYLLYFALLNDTVFERYEGFSLYLFDGLFEKPVLSFVVTLTTLWFVVEYEFEDL